MQHNVEPRIVTELPGPRAAALLARDRAVISPSYTRDYPLVVARGEGCWIEDVDGNRFLDLTAGIAVTSTGHCHPQVVAAITDQAARLIHMSGTDFYYEAEIALAERLVAITPGDWPKRVFLANSGAESIEAALKLVRYHTRRPRVIAFRGAFHGRTSGALALGGSKAIHQRGFGAPVGGVHRLPFNCTREEVDELLRTACPADEVAAIFVEPIQGEGGYRVARDGFLQMLRETCDEYAIPLVFDEIQCGMGRTGRWMACDHWNVAPDVVCLAKGIASGMPLGAVVARAEMMQWPPGSHASTFGGNPISCRAALATIDLLERSLMNNATVRGAQLSAALVELVATQPMHFADARGVGLMQAVDVVDANGPSPERRYAVLQAAFQRGLLLLGCGLAGIRFCPALAISSEEIGAAVRILSEVGQRGAP
jgi:4-aminobutyrate aminotransferase